MVQLCLSLVPIFASCKVILGCLLRSDSFARLHAAMGDNRRPGPGPPEVKGTFSLLVLNLHFNTTKVRLRAAARCARQRALWAPTCARCSRQRAGRLRLVHRA